MGIEVTWNPRNFLPHQEFLCGNRKRQQMADDPKIRGSHDRQRINLHERYEVEYWTSKWHISREQLAEAVKKVGPMSAAVAKQLGKEL